MPFGWCPCALFIELSSTSLEAYYQKGENLTHNAAHITYIQKTYIDGMPKPQVGSYRLKITPPFLPFGEILGSHCGTGCSFTYQYFMHH